MRTRQPNNRRTSNVTLALNIAFIVGVFFTVLSLFSLAFDDDKSTAFDDFITAGAFTVVVIIIRRFWVKRHQ